MSNNIVHPKPRSKKEDLLPSLSVKADPSLKLCLSTTSLIKPHSDHASILLQEDNVSPIAHGIAPDSGTQNKPSTSATIANTPAITPAVLTRSRTPVLPTKGSPGSILLSAPNSPPLLFDKPVLTTSNVSLNASHPPITNLNPTLPPLSRVSSLRYANDDKGRIQQRTSLPALIAASSPQLDSSRDPLLLLPTKKHLLLAVTGCISIHKNVFLIIEKLFELYSREKLEIQVILTKLAQWFLLEKLPKFEKLGVKVWFHDDNWKVWHTNRMPFVPGKPVKITPALLSKYLLAFELLRWTDVLLIAPLLANSMAKMINGLLDNLLLELLQQWPLPAQSVGAKEVVSESVSGSTSAPGGSKVDSTVLSNNLQLPKAIIAAIALTNTMYAHPITKIQLSQLQDTYPNILILKPTEKCVDVDGNISMGGMRSWREVVNFTVQKLGSPDEDEDEDDIKEEEEEEEREEQEKVVHRHRTDTLTMKEIKQHDKIATINAMLNTGMSPAP